MTSDEAAFNRIPPQCAGVEGIGACPLDQADVDKHNLVLTLGCNGPSFEAPDPQESVHITDGKITEITPGKRSALGRTACTNPGFKLWLLEKMTDFNAV